MGKKKNEIGNKYGRLEVISEAYKASGGFYWNCVCDCGNELIVLGTSLRRGNTRSCGCYNRDMSIQAHKIHGLHGTRISRIHQNMKARCNNPNNTWYHNYGGRGIKVCDEWNKLENFAEWAFRNGYSDSLTIDRIDNDKGYCPDNCRWVSKREQDFNKRIYSTNTSGYSGISYLKDRNCFASNLYGGNGDRKVFIGYFKTFMEAYRARRKAEIETYGRYLYSEPDLEEIKNRYTPEMFGE